MQEEKAIFVLYMLNGERYCSLITQSLIKLKLYNTTSNSAHHVSHHHKPLPRIHSVCWKEADLFHAHAVRSKLFLIRSPTSLNLILQIQAVFSQTIYFELKNEQVQLLKVMHR